MDISYNAYIYILIYLNYIMVIWKHNKKTTLSYKDIVYCRWVMCNHHITTYNKKSLRRSLCGVGCIALGVCTALVPFTTIPLCVLGAGLLGFDIRPLILRIKYESHRLRVTYGK